MLYLCFKVVLALIFQVQPIKYDVPLQVTSLNTFLSNISLLGELFGIFLDDNGPNGND